MKNLIFLLLILSVLSCSHHAIRPGNEIDKSSSNRKDDASGKIVFLIGDGMGLSQVSSLVYSIDNISAFERFNVIGFHKSYSADDLITDSAAGASAFSIGEKTNNGYLGVDKNNNPKETILETANKQGLSTGMVVSSTIVHATPAAFVAHVNDRNSYEAIAVDLLDSGCDLLIGGGEKYFNRRITDSLNLNEELQRRNYVVTDYFEKDWKEMIIPAVDKFVYFTADGDPLPASMGREYLPKSSIDALNFLNRKKNGFFLMIEGSQIDWGGHANDYNYVLTEMKDFNSVLNQVLDWAQRDGNTTVVVTGDHETGGLSILPGSVKGKLQTHFSTTKHTGCLIPVYAFGPGAKEFAGIYENTEIYFKLRKLLLKK